MVFACASSCALGVSRPCAADLNIFAIACVLKLPHDATSTSTDKCSYEQICLNMTALLFYPFLLLCEPAALYTFVNIKTNECSLHA